MSERGAFPVFPSVAVMREYDDSALLGMLATAARDYLLHDGSGMKEHGRWSGDFSARDLIEARERLRSVIEAVLPDADETKALRPFLRRWLDSTSRYFDELDDAWHATAARDLRDWLAYLDGGSD